MEFKFTAATKPKKLDGITKQRAQLIKRINEQIAILENHDGGPLPRRSWAWQDESGNWLLGVQYGYKPLELKKGMTAVQCDSLAHSADALSVLIATES